MSKDGFDLRCGKHCNKLSGYYAVFYDRRDMKDKNVYEPLGGLSDCWSSSGHAEDLEDAVIMAADLALGRDVEVPPTAQFGAK